MQRLSKDSGSHGRHATKRKTRIDAPIGRRLTKKPRRGSLGPKDSVNVAQHGGDIPETLAVADWVSTDDLLAEIRALGGDEEDLQLVCDASTDSDDELEGPPQVASQSLHTELAGFASQLGLYQTNRPESEQADELFEQEPLRPSQAPSQSTGSSKELLFEPRPDWHSAPVDVPAGLASQETMPYSHAVESLKNYARELLQKDSSFYAKSAQSSSTQRFLSTIMSSGTMNDKVSALTLAIQESPVHNVRALDGLLNLASKKSRSQAIIALAAVVDLMGAGLVLPRDRKLVHFHRQPLLLAALQKDSIFSWNPTIGLPTDVTPAHLIMWAYEDWLKGAYFQVVQLLELWSDDEIDYSRTRALDFISCLLREKPEQESNLLKLLVTKLGDRDRRLASRSSHLLLQLQEIHPGMRGVIVRAIEQEVILRPGQSLRARYYALNTLNQTILSSRENSVTTDLLRIYFDVFAAMLKSREMGSASMSRESASSSQGHSDKQSATAHLRISTNTNDFAEKVTSAILVGINRALPFVDGNDAILESQLDTLFKIVHSSNFNTSIQAMLLIQQLSGSRNVAADRFYRVLYESLLDPRLITSSKQAMYLNLLLRATKADVNVRRAKAFVKRMLQVLVFQQPSFACGVLYIISQLRTSFPGLATLIEEPEESDERWSTENPGSACSARNTQQRYDGRKRDPEFSDAHRTCLWEIVPILRHFHPAVLAYASSLVGVNTPMQKPDLESHTLIRFLDKFAYRNPKSKDSMRGSSIMQPMRANVNESELWLRSKGAAAASQSLNNAAFWVKKSKDIAVEDLFFHHYFNQVGRNTGVRTSGLREQDKSVNEDDTVLKALTAGDELHGEDWDVEIDEEDHGSILSDWDLSSHSEEADDDLLGESDTDIRVGEDLDHNVEDAMEPESSAPQPKRRRRALKDLPTFASVEEYADLLQQEQA